MKTLLKISLLFLCCISCNEENHFSDLSKYDDFMMVITVYFDSEKINEPYDYTLIDYKTNSYGELISYPTSPGGNIPTDLSHTQYYAVKEFKTVGITIIPTQNVVAYQFQIKEISPMYPDSFPIVYIENSIEKETTIYYDFETKKTSIN